MLLRFIFIIFAIISFCFLADLSFAAVTDIIDYKPQYLVSPPSSPEDTAESYLLTIVAQVIDILLYFAGIVAVLMMLYGGARYVANFGNKDADKKGKEIITYSVAGLLMIICSALIVDNAERIIKFILGG